MFPEGLWRRLLYIFDSLLTAHKGWRLTTWLVVQWDKVPETKKSGKGKKEPKRRGPYHIVYEDEEVEWVDLKQERWTPVAADAKAAEPAANKKSASAKKSGKADKPQGEESAQPASEKKKAADKEKKAPEKKGAAAEPEGGATEPEAPVKAADAPPKTSKAKGKSKAAKAEEKPAEKDGATDMEVDEAAAEEAPAGKVEGPDGDGDAGDAEAAPAEGKGKADKAGRKRKVQIDAPDGADAGKGKGRGPEAKKPAKAGAKTGPASPKPRKPEAQGVFSTNEPWEAVRGMKGGKPKPELLLKDEAMYKVWLPPSSPPYWLFHKPSPESMHCLAWLHKRGRGRHCDHHTPCKTVFVPNFAWGTMREPLCWRVFAEHDGQSGSPCQSSGFMCAVPVQC